MCGPHHYLGRGAFAPDSAIVCLLLQRDQNASVVGQRRADLSPGSAGRKPKNVPHPRRTPSPLLQSLGSRVVDVNLIGVFLGLKHVIPAMAATGGGSIINSSSVAGLTGTPRICAYNATKHGVIGLTRSAAAEWAGRGVRVNSINPGLIASRMMASLEDGMAPGKAQEMRAQFSAMIPAGRYGIPEEAAAVVAFLASDDARYLHGAIFTIDGGFTVS